MTALDFLVIAVYLVIIFGIGLWAGRGGRAESLEDFFVGGRELPWWLLGTSMVATTFAADTPLTVAGLSIAKGVAGNWFWWSMAVSHVFVAVVLARLWRRAAVVTDAELCELRYDGRAASFLRVLKGFYFAIPINCIILGWVFRAMVKVSGEVVPELSPAVVLAVLFVATLAYSVRSGFRGVVLTDLVQFPFALAGAVVLAVFAVDAAGGLEPTVAAAVARGGEAAVDLLPTDGELLPWHALVAFLGIQWWAQKNADGGGIFVQRLLSARSERDAELGGLWFCVAHYVLRPWPWVLTGLAAIVVVPEVVAADPEAAYGALVVKVLPAGLRGLLVASFLAAFMSTIDTHLNWGASYVVNDILGRGRGWSEAEAARASRWATLAIGALAIASALAIDTIAGAWEFLTAFGAGAGATVLLRWFWWRITAQAEIAAMVASTLLSTSVYLLAPEWPYLAKLSLIAFGSAAVWLLVAWRTAPDPRRLVAFYETVRPPGPGWAAVARHSAVPAQPIGRDLFRWAMGLAVVLGALVATGSLLLQ